MAPELWRELVDSQVFWGTVAAASTALLIAVVLEGRTGRELLDAQTLQVTAKRLAASEVFEQKWVTWQAEWTAYEQDEGDDPGPPPTLVRPLPPEEAGAQKQALQTGSRLVVLLLSLWALAGALIGSLIIVSPAHYPGDAVAAAGIVITLLCVVLGGGGLLYATSTRITKG